jgi:adenine-specific DNA methylase
MPASTQDVSYVTTRYPGSKRKLLDWIVDQTRGLKYHSVLDAFAGTGCVSYVFKSIGKQVTYNDILTCNYYTGLALIENSRHRLTEEDVSWVVSKHGEFQYPSFIQDTFHDIYFTHQENAWLDMAITNIRHMKNRYKKALALHALFQSCLVKRPFNAFHRRNLYLRLADVKRSFRNHVTWDRPFQEYFRRFSLEANSCVFDNGQRNTAWNFDVFRTPREDFDLVYIDPPYTSTEGRSVDYQHLYNFLEGLCDYDGWVRRIDYHSINRRLKLKRSSWKTGKRSIETTFEKLFERFQDSILLVSYRSPGLPSVAGLKGLLERYKRKVRVRKTTHRYVLSKQEVRNFEVLFVAT